MPASGSGKGAEAWINPEIDQGFGLSGSVGVAGFPSGEAYKVGADYPYTRLHRAFLRQTIDLGGEVQKVDAGLNQFSGSQTSDRLVFTVGKIGVVDIFDTNKYAHDPRGDFMNWTDHRHRNVRLRGGRLGLFGRRGGGMVSRPVDPARRPVRPFNRSESNHLDPQFGQFQWVGEIERRYSIWDQPGKLAITGFLTRGRMGSFEDAIQLAALTRRACRYRGRAAIPEPGRRQHEPGAATDAQCRLLCPRRNRGWRLKNPTNSPTSTAPSPPGLSVSGKQWGRDDDTFGIAGVVNGISGVHQAFLNAGGLGILVGDGQLPNPGTEKILETYYSFPVLYFEGHTGLSAHRQSGLQSRPGPCSGARVSAYSAYAVLQRDGSIRLHF